MGEWRESERQIDPLDFEEFFTQSEPPVRFALSARFGFEVGREAAAEALTYAWAHWTRIQLMENPAGYVYRVGERLGRRMSTRTDPVDFSRAVSDLPMVEPKLGPALLELSAKQRTAVVLVHGLGWTHRETADFLGMSTSSVQKHVTRGMVKLRRRLRVNDGA